MPPFPVTISEASLRRVITFYRTLVERGKLSPRRMHRNLGLTWLWSGCRDLTSSPSPAWGPQVSFQRRSLPYHMRTPCPEGSHVPGGDGALGRGCTGLTEWLRRVVSCTWLFWARGSTAFLGSGRPQHVETQQNRDFSKSPAGMMVCGLVSGPQDHDPS